MKNKYNKIIGMGISALFLTVSMIGIATPISAFGCSATESLYGPGHWEYANTSEEICIGDSISWWDVLWMSEAEEDSIFFRDGLYYYLEVTVVKIWVKDFPDGTILAGKLDD